ncbi:MAG TPA: hypothetical protein VLK28_14015 [Methylomirabilota bacterium]|nr:hypothetical protein [Methylomirabilota bacterium]
MVAGLSPRPQLRRLTVAGLLLCALLGADPPAAAQPTLPLPAQLPPKDRRELEEIVKHAFASTQRDLEPYVVRPEVFEYLLDHPEFASHVTRALKAARYRIWREAGSLWLDDGWGVKGTFAVAHAEPGLRIMRAQGAYQSALPDIKGRAVVALVYRFQPAPQGRQQIATTLTAFVQIDSGVVRAIGRMGGPVVQKKADREARGLLRVFSKVSRAIEDSPADVYARLRGRPDVPQPELEEFRKLLRVP